MIIAGVLLALFGLLIATLIDWNDKEATEKHNFSLLALSFVMLTGGMLFISNYTEKEGQKYGAYMMLHHQYHIQYIYDENHCVIDSIIVDFENK